MTSYIIWHKKEPVHLIHIMKFKYVLYFKDQLETILEVYTYTYVAAPIVLFALLLNASCFSQFCCDKCFAQGILLVYGFSQFCCDKCFVLGMAESRKHELHVHTPHFMSHLSCKMRDLVLCICKKQICRSTVKLLHI